MNTRWTDRLVSAAPFTASGPKGYTDYADRDADSRRVRSEQAASRVRFAHIRFHMPAGRADRATSRRLTGGHVTPITGRVVT